MNARANLINTAYVGLLAANSAILAKYSNRREPSFGRVPARYAPPSMSHVVRLLDPSLDSRGGHEQRLARAAATAALHAYESRRDGRSHALSLNASGVARQLATASELRRSHELRELSAHRVGSFDGLDAGAFEMCRYCAMFHHLLHELQEVPVEVLNHGARISSDFDPRTNICEAKIDDFQLLLPQDKARKAIERSHPLNWKASAPLMFEDVSAIEPGSYKGDRFDLQAGPVALREWTLNDRSKVLLYELARFPWNEEVSSRVENILLIRELANVLVPTTALLGELPRVSQKQRDASGVMARIRRANVGRLATPERRRTVLNEAPWSHDDARVLTYRYSLEACLGSSYGVNWEQYSGLDLDDGLFSGSAVHYRKISEELVGHLTPADLNHLMGALMSHYGRRGELPRPAAAAITILARLAGNPSRMTASRTASAIRRVAAHLKTLWNGQDPWLLTISASKRLRYTFPRNTPASLWQTLTWLTPAVLFTFINRSVCQLPQALFREEGGAQDDTDT